VVDLFAAWNSHDLDRIAALYAPEYEGIDVGWPSPRRGPADVRRGWERYLAAFPDLQFDLGEVVVEGSRAALTWTVRGTHRGVLMGIPATHRPIAVQGTSFCRVAGGKLVQAQHVWDVAGLLRNIGLLPEL
jgi:steroid delta-isomerase-like uncharacterized protein